MRWMLYLVPKLTTLLGKYKLTEEDDEICRGKELAFYDICSVQDPSTLTIQKKGHCKRITDSEGALQQLRVD